METEETSWDFALKSFVQRQEKLYPWEHYIYQNVPTDIQNNFIWFLNNCKSRVYDKAGLHLNSLDCLVEELQRNIFQFPSQDYQSLLNVLSDFQANERLGIFNSIEDCLSKMEIQSKNSQLSLINPIEQEANLGVLSGFVKMLENNWKQRDTFLENINPTSPLMLSILHELEHSVSLISQLLSLYSQVTSLWKYNGRHEARSRIKYSAVINNVAALVQGFPEIIQPSITQIKNIELIFVKNQMTNNTEALAKHLEDLKNMFGKLLKEQMTLAFTVEEHPPDVLNTDQKFTVSVSLLTGNKLSVCPGPVEVFVLHQEMAKNVYNGNIESVVGGDLLKFFDKMQSVAGNNNKYSYSKELLLEKRPGNTSRDKDLRKGEEKVALLFTCKIKVAEFEFTVWAISLPLILATHFSQKSLAFFTMYWDSEFSELYRKPFEVCDSVTWTQLENMLNRYFCLHAERDLTPAEKATLKRKLIGNSQCEEVSRYKLYDDAMEGKVFSFWIWFYHINKMISGPLKSLWMKKRIQGIIDSDVAKRELSRSTSRTFLLRFSDSVLEAISIVWRHTDGNMYLLSPIVAAKTARELAIKVMTLDSLEHLYPHGTPKKIVFEDIDTTSLYATFAKLRYYVRLKLDVDVYQKNNQVVHCRCPHCGCEYNMILKEPTNNDTPNSSDDNMDTDDDDGFTGNRQEKVPKSKNWLGKIFSK